MKNDFECGLLDRAIWRDIKCSKRNYSIIKSDLFTNELEELNNIESLLSGYIKSLGFEHSTGKWYKTDTGYNVVQYCNQMKDCRCKSLWSLKVNVITGRAEIYLTKHCDHFDLE